MAPILLPLFLGAVTITAVSVLALEARRHRSRLSTLQHRIHVNGTRGKTEVTELIGDAMRNAGVRTWSKSTGKATRIIDHDGVEIPFKRSGPPNIREQMEFMEMTSGAGARGAVVECMAITPELQVTSTRMVGPSIGVITNVRLEHTDVMGPGIDDIAEALAGTIPENGVLVTGDRRFYPYFRDISKTRRTRIVLADSRKLPEDIIAAFRNHQNIENVAVAWAVCEAMGIESSALIGTNIKRDRKAHRINVSGIRMTVIDALGSNDAESTRMALEGVDTAGPVVGLFIGRSDRPGRAVEMAEGFLPSAGFDGCYAIGPGAKLFSSRTRDVMVIGVAKGIVERIAHDVGEDMILFAFGNRTGRTAEEVLKELRL